MKSCLAGLISCVSLVAFGADNPPTAPTSTRLVTATESKTTAEAVAQWQAWRFGLFIHWGPASLTGNEISWSRGGTTSGMIPTEEYDNLYKKFNPVRFDADAWAKTAKDAGMKYLVLTAKHADGFCLWPSKFTDYHIGNSPFKRDVVKELATACQRQGIRFSTYYCITDWWHPDYPLGSPGGKTKKPNPNMPRYFEYVKNQTRELIENYGPLGLLWFDIGDAQVWAPEYKSYGNELYRHVKTLQPSLVVNDRCMQSPPPSGDYSTLATEGKVGDFNRTRPWETCTVIGGHWAWCAGAKTAYMSFQQCLQMLLHVVGNDGNFLLNVGPNADGQIEPEHVARLQEIGAWLAKYGDGVYGTRGGPFIAGRWGAATCKENKIFLFLMKWPQRVPLELPAIPVRITAFRSLSGGTAEVRQNPDGITLSLPVADRDPVVTVVELTVDGKAFDIPPVAVTAFTSQDRRLQGLVDLTKQATYVISDEINPTWNADKSGLLTETKRTSPFAFHTQKGKDEHIVIDLQKVATIKRIEIENRTDVCQERAKTLTVWVSPDRQAWQEIWRADRVEPDWTIELTDTAVQAQYVKIGLQAEAEYFHLNKVRIYGE